MILRKGANYVICCLASVLCFGCTESENRRSNDQDQFVKIAKKLGATVAVNRGSIRLEISEGKLSRFSSLPTLEGVKKIVMSDVEIDDEEFFNRFESIGELSLYDCEFRLESTASIDNVNVLNIRQVDRNLFHRDHDLLRFSGLEYITLSGKQIDSEFFGALMKSNKRILQLVIFGTDLKSFGFLKDLPRLERLVIRSSRMDRPTIPSLENITSLSNVELSGTTLAVGRFPKELNQLTMRRVSFDSPLELYVKGCKDITWLDISDFVIDDVSFFSQFKERLERFYVRNCGIKDFGFIAGFNSLRHLSLSTVSSFNCEVLPPEVRTLTLTCKEITNLRSLFNSKISHLSLDLPKPCFRLEHLSGIKSLESLSLVNRLVNAKELEELMAQLKIEVDVFD